MRVTVRVPLPPGALAPGRINPAQLPDVRDPSLPYPVGRVVSVHADTDALILELDLNEARLAERLAEYRPVF